MKIKPQDQADRVCAATTFDQNIVVTAGAGTGKTTLLINRLLHLLMRGTDAMPLTSVVALTFTNKSANEMKVRLRDALENLIADDGTSQSLIDLMESYGLSKSSIDMRAAAALQEIERSEIGTIHHFAATLLRLYPIEAGLDPQFRIDESGDLFRQCFESSWRDWLQKELVLDGPQKTLWENVLAACSLKEIKALAECLVSEPLHFSSLFKKKDKKEIPLPIVAWLKSLEGNAEALLEVHPEGRKIEVLLATARTCFQNIGQEERSGLSEQEADFLCSGKATRVKGWEEDEFKIAQNLIKIAQQLLQIDEDKMQGLCELLKPFVMFFQQKAHEEAWLSFDTLLVSARDLLQNHPPIREALKLRYQAILIDEFQDTDPVQYEILLYLAEVSGKSAKNWQAVKLAAGKLFVVGDPKQSIYGFRRADIEAYHAVRDLIFQQGGIHCTLSTNFRSHGKILDVVNGLFEGVMIEKTGLQPQYIPIHPPEFEDSFFKTCDFKFRAVSLRLLQNTRETWTAETAKQAEGEAIAQWLSAEVLEKAMILGEDGKTRSVQKADVAILMRTLTGVQHILVPLRRLGIAYWVEGEKHFYRKQGVIDAVNLLRAVSDASDKIALSAVLRSPVGGLDDEAIYGLEKNGVLNYRCESEFLDKHVIELYAMFSRLHEVAGRFPVAKAVSTIFDESPLRLLAAGENDGAQALANLEKIEQEVAALSKESPLTFRAVVAVLEKSVRSKTEAAESSLAEAGVDAVKVFSIHKAKGLEFPVVILAGCQAALSPKEGNIASLRHDWSSALTGLRLGEMRDLNAIFLKEKMRLREMEEEKRLFYVAMTRAREHLMISATAKDKIQPGSFLSHLEAVCDPDVLPCGDHSDRGSDAPMISVGQGQIVLKTLSEVDLEEVTPLIENPSVSQVNISVMQAFWKKRFLDYALLKKEKIFSSPTELKKMDEGEKRDFYKNKNAVQNLSADMSAWLGEVSHRFLEGWDFSTDLKNYRDKLFAFVAQQRFPNKEMTREILFEEMDAIFKVFFFSPAYEALTKVKILGREVPFLMPHQGYVMRGEIDLIYETEGQLYIADYKTDRLEKTEIAAAAKQYHHQSKIYSEVVQSALQREVAGMKFIFLRLGVSC